jgi:methylated-DNA-protein-cysteine methyltransferase-like protein
VTKSRGKKSFDALFRPHAVRRAGRAHRAVDPCENPTIQMIWDIVALIPAGQASTYGEVARAAGLPRGARQAGYALRVMPEELKLPWYRVVAAGGRIAFPPGSRHFREQVRRLRAEGVSVTQGRVDARVLMRSEQF